MPMVMHTYLKLGVRTGHLNQMDPWVSWAPQKKKGLFIRREVWALEVNRSILDVSTECCE